MPIELSESEYIVFTAHPNTIFLEPEFEVARQELVRRGFVTVSYNMDTMQPTVALTKIGKEILQLLDDDAP